MYQIRKILAFSSYFFLANLIKNKSIFLIEKLYLIPKRSLELSLIREESIEKKMIFVIIKKFFIFQKPWERGGIGRRTALKMRHLRVCRFKSDRSHFDEYL